MQRLYLNAIGSLINKKDARTIKKWCKTNQLDLYTDSSGIFAYKQEFDIVYDLPLIKRLKVVYGDKWDAMYKVYKDGELHKLIDMEPVKKARYIPQGNIAKKINKSKL